MDGYIQTEPNTKTWKEGFFSELQCGRPVFERFLASAATVEGDEETIRGLLSREGNVSRFLVPREGGAVVCLGVLENDRKTTTSFWKRLFKKP